MEGDSLAAGAVLAERYRVVSPLGRGGMGAVFRVFDEMVGEDVALKLIGKTDGEALASFRSELRLARKVTHKNVGRTFDMGRGHGVLFLTMELVVGQSLRDLLNQHGRLPVGDVAHIGGRIAAGLAAAHEVGVIHRDLKPGNVLLGEDGRIVVIDWGIASLRGPSSRDGVSGTPDYMSPEQLLGRAPDPSHDVYSLGLVLFELLMGRRVFQGPSAQARAIARLDGPADLAAVPRESPLLPVLERCLFREPFGRPLASEVEQTLAAIVSDPPTFRAKRAALQPEVDATAIEPAVPTLTVLPFDVEGEDERFGLGEALAEELSDALAVVRGLLVISSRTSDKADARYRVTGRVARTPTGLSVRARLVERPSGAQLWTGQFDSPLRESFEATQAMAARIAETLRMELEFLSGAPSLPEAAALAFLEGRRQLRTPLGVPFEASRSFARCLEGSPEFAPAIAGHALALARAWSSPGRSDTTREAVARAVDLAIDRAGALADSHVAEGLLAAADGDFRAMQVAIGRALSLAPNHGKAHEVLGRIEVESGQAERGARRLMAALRIDPTLHLGMSLIARGHALRGRPDDFDRMMEDVLQLGPVAGEHLAMRARVALWYLDRARASRMLDLLPQYRGERSRPVRAAEVLARRVAGELETWEVREMMRGFLAEAGLSRRNRCTVFQVSAEIEAAIGDPIRALGYVESAMELDLVDAEWLGLCPALDVIRDHDRFLGVQEQMRMRVAELWARHAVPPLPSLAEG